VLRRATVPWLPGGRPRSAPAFRQIGQFAQRGVPLVHLPEAHNPCVRGVVGRPAQELPATIIGVVRDQKDRRASSTWRVVIDAVLGVSANGQRSTISPRVRPPKDMQTAFG